MQIVMNGAYENVYKMEVSFIGMKKFQVKFDAWDNDGMYRFTWTFNMVDFEKVSKDLSENDLKVARANIAREIYNCKYLSNKVCTDSYWKEYRRLKKKADDAYWAEETKNMSKYWTVA